MARKCILRNRYYKAVVTRDGDFKHFTSGQSTQNTPTNNVDFDRVSLEVQAMLYQAMFYVGRGGSLVVEVSVYEADSVLPGP